MHLPAWPELRRAAAGGKGRGSPPTAAGSGEPSSGSLTLMRAELNAFQVHPSCSVTATRRHVYLQLFFVYYLVADSALWRPLRPLRSRKQPFRRSIEKDLHNNYAGFNIFCIFPCANFYGLKTNKKIMKQLPVKQTVTQHFFSAIY